MTDTRAALEFLQKLIQTPSLPGQEGTVAAIVLSEMRELGYDETWIDEAGNVVGKIRGRGEAPAVMFNTHLDHVDAGDPAAWPPYGQPFSGAAHDGKVWGRGSSDIKGPLAAQVYGVARVLQDAERPAGDIYVSADVQEEVGGLGARFMAEDLADKIKFVVIGEPSSNELRRGHRGRTELVVHVWGRAVHASVPDIGINPLYTIANFLQRLEDVELGWDEELGYSSVAPTLIRTDQTSANVVPGEAWLTLDWRTVPGETSDIVKQKVAPLLEASLTDGATAELYLPALHRVSYNGYVRPMESDAPAFCLPSDDPAVLAAEQVLSKGLGRPIPTKVWRFATDGGHYARAGMKVIGFGPGNEAVIHTVNEHIEIAEWEEAMVANAILAREWASTAR